MPQLRWKINWNFRTGKESGTQPLRSLPDGSETPHSRGCASSRYSLTELLRTSRLLTVARAVHFIPRRTPRSRATVADLSLVVTRVVTERWLALQVKVTACFTADRPAVPPGVKAARIACSWTVLLFIGGTSVRRRESHKGGSALTLPGVDAGVGVDEGVGVGATAELSRPPGVGVFVGVGVGVCIEDGVGDSDGMDVADGVCWAGGAAGGVASTRGEEVGVGVVVGVAVAVGDGTGSVASGFSTRIMTASATLYRSLSFAVSDAIGAYALTESFPVVDV